MSVTLLQGVTHACFGLSYLLALLLEVARMLWPGTAWWRRLGLTFGGLGLLTQTFYLLFHRPTPAAPYGSLLLLAWVLALFYLYGTFHHARRAWAVFVLPVVILLVGLSFVLVGPGGVSPEFGVPAWISGERLWGVIHGSLLLLGAVGVSVGFLASVMYLVQSHRLRKKVNPGRAVPLLSLERLETMNRRAIALAFPLLTAGLLLGTLLLRHYHDIEGNWLSLKVLSTGALWLVFGVLVYLRYGTNVPPRRLAWLSVLAFVLLLVALIAAHPFAAGGVS